MPPPRLQDPPGNPALLDSLPAVVRAAARGGLPIVRLLDGSSSPLLLVGFRREVLGQSLSVKEGIACLDRGEFSLPVEQGDLHALRGHPVQLEERPQIALSLLAPMMHDQRPSLHRASTHDAELADVGFLQRLVALLLG